MLGQLGHDLMTSYIRRSFQKLEQYNTWHHGTVRVGYQLGIQVEGSSIATSVGHSCSWSYSWSYSWSCVSCVCGGEVLCPGGGHPGLVHGHHGAVRVSHQPEESLGRGGHRGNTTNNKLQGR